MQFGYENHKREQELLPFTIGYHTVETDEAAPFAGNWHENLEFLCIAEGEGCVYLSGEVYPIQSGDLICINEDVFHAVKSSHVEYYCLIVDPVFFVSNGIEKKTFTPHICHANLCRPFMNLKKLYDEKQEYYIPRLRLSVLHLMLYLVENFSVSLSAAKTGCEYVKAAVTFIKENSAEKISIEAISAHVGISRAHLSRQFKKATGVSMITYLNYIRCRNARNMLRNGEHIGTAALLCGFDNLSYFSAVYKKLMGNLPSEDRLL